VEPTYDVFLGHASADKPAGVREFADELERLRLRTFVDERAIGAFDPITQEVEEAIGESLVFVAWYSRRYPERRACQLELRRAYVAAEGAHKVGERIFAVNPESGFAHIHPATLRDARIPSEGAAEAILARVSAVRMRGGEPLGALTRLDAPTWIPQRRLGSPRFVGRVSELWDLHEHLQAHKISQVTGTGREEVALIGFGGIGKSLLAEEYAYSFGPAYPGGIYWLSATDAVGGDESVLLDNLAAIAAALELNLEDRPEPAVLRHRMALALAEHERALWIVDDLPAGLAPAELQSWLAPHEQAATLITTRSSAYSALPQISLHVLDRQLALLLLTAGLEPSSEEEWEAARLIASELLGGHAQSLDVARSQIGLHPGGSAYREFVQRTRKTSVVERLEHAARITAELPSGHETSIVATMHTAIEGLGEDARDLLRTAGELAVAPIDLDLAARVIAGEAQIRHAAADRLDGGLSQLRQSSLARPAVTAGGESAFFVHGLVSAVARHIDTAPERAAALCARATAVLAEWFSTREDLHDQARAPQLESRVTHARHVTGVLDRTADANVAALGSWLAHLDYERGAYSGAQTLGEQVLAAFERLLGEEHPDTLTSKNDLAATLRAKGELAAARRLQEEVLAAFERLQGEEHPDTLASKHELALTLYAHGELAAARRLQEEMLAACERLLGEEHSDTLTGKSNLALTLRAQGELAAARRLQEEVLAARARLLGDEHPATLIGKDNLAATLHDQGELAAARRLQEEVLAARERLLGDEHPATLASKDNLSVTLHEQGELAAARRLQEEVLAARERLLGKEHRDTLTVKNNLASTLHEQGDLAAARRLLEELATAFERLLGDEHLDTLASKDNLSVTLHEQGELAPARRLQEEVLAARERLLGEEHPDTLKGKSNLAATLHDQGDMAAARRLQEEVLAARERLLGEEHPDSLASKDNLSVTVHEQGDLAAARRLQEDVLAARERLLGKEHPDTLKGKSNLAATLRAQGDLAAARRLQEEVLAAFERLLGEEHPVTLIGKDNLAATLHMQNELAAARRLQQEVLAARERLLSEEHPDTLASKHDLAATLHMQGDLAAARRLQEEVLAARERLLGEEHPDTLASKHNLAVTLGALGERNVSTRGVRARWRELRRRLAAPR
jgi:Tetratricopeptide repeat/TIR domain